MFKWYDFVSQIYVISLYSYRKPEFLDCLEKCWDSNLLLFKCRKLKKSKVKVTSSLIFWLRRPLSLSSLKNLWFRFRTFSAQMCFYVLCMTHVALKGLNCLFFTWCKNSTWLYIIIIHRGFILYKFSFNSFLTESVKTLEMTEKLVTMLLIFK